MHDMSYFESVLHVTAGLMEELEDYDENKKKTFALLYNIYVHEIDKDEEVVDVEYLGVLHNSLRDHIRSLANYVLIKAETVSI